VYGIDAFVAHDDIQPTREWENEIIAALRSCHALVALLSDDAHASSWVDQECGWAMGRGVPVIPVDIGSVPYGFLARYQALAGRERTAANIAERIFEILRANPSTYWTLIEGLVTAFEQSVDFIDANTKFSLMAQLPLLGLTEDHLDRIEAAQRRNGQVAGAFRVQRSLRQLVDAQRRAWSQERDTGEPGTTDG
jgi:hypothetical protein